MWWGFGGRAGWRDRLLIIRAVTMKLREMIESLRSEQSFWAKQSDYMVWCAARYYIGIDDIATLEQQAQPVPVTSDFTLDPPLAYGQVREIIRLR